MNANTSPRHLAWCGPRGRLVRSVARIRSRSHRPRCHATTRAGGRSGQPSSVQSRIEQGKCGHVSLVRQSRQRGGDWGLAGSRASGSVTRTSTTTRRAQALGRPALDHAGNRQPGNRQPGDRRCGCAVCHGRSCPEACGSAASPPGPARPSSSRRPGSAEARAAGAPGHAGRGGTRAGRNGPRPPRGRRNCRRLELNRTPASLAIALPSLSDAQP